MTSPPPTPANGQRPMSAMVRPSRSGSRMSMTSPPSGSRASDEEARTSVRVAVRVRPPLRPTDPGFDLVPARFQKSMVQVTSESCLTIESPHGRKLFAFDRVFAPDIDQGGVWQYLADSVNSFVQGYNVSVLAYGQSGAGKSYTMGTSGPSEQQDPSTMGVIPRAARCLFEKLETRPAAKVNRSSMSHLRSHRHSILPSAYSLPADCSWSLRATYVEIYNEQLRDLLLPESVNVQERPAVSIREDVKGNIILTGLHQIDIESADDLMNALNFGSSIRQTDVTAINAKSSRSHAVFSLNLVQRKSSARSPDENRFSAPLEAMMGSEAGWITTDSKLHFVDLAGSERLKNTGAQGERAREGISINAGLASLGKVISQLSSRQPGAHVSYRDSRLTRLLQDSLGGNAITYMIACVTPAEFHISETLNTVQYAQRARAIQTKPHIQQIDDGDKQALIDRLRAEVSFLRAQIRSADRTGSGGGSGSGGSGLGGIHGGGNAGLSGRLAGGLSSNSNSIVTGLGSNRRRAASQERIDRQSEREMELQTQLLDFQETYTALSSRHAKLVAELARSHEEVDAADAAGGPDFASERLTRSSAFAHRVEQVVLEYEKTIQSLEQSLSNTRGTLSNTEESLLEKETRCAYVDTINAQLQSRIQKVLDREASTESYLTDLEAKLDGHTSGDEKNASIIQELRRETARLRENESACEDYISTLEERLAETDQDAELMQREIERLEQVVERQRSLGKLDSLLYELDNGRDDARPNSSHRLSSTNRQTAGLSADPTDALDAAEPASVPLPDNGDAGLDSDRGLDHDDDLGRDLERERDYDVDCGPDQARVRPFPSSPSSSVAPGSHLSRSSPTSHGTLSAPHSAQANVRLPSPSSLRTFRGRRGSVAHQAIAEEPTVVSVPAEFPPVSPAQSKFVADKLETVTQELVGLRVEHETLVNELDGLQGKYEDALRALAEIQNEERPMRVRDSIASTRADSSLSGAAQSRSLSSELSSALGSPLTADTSEVETAMTARAMGPTPKSHSLVVEVEHLRSAVADHEDANRELVGRLADLEHAHHQTLDEVEELKTVISKTRAVEATSPRSTQPIIIHRKSSQGMMVIDRAHRSFASLRNLAAENFEDQPDVLQSFELNMNAAMHELHTRSERIQELEVELASAKREMEAKTTLISGLARERSSFKPPSMDMTVMASLRDQLERNEADLRAMRQHKDDRERELVAEIETLRQTSVGREREITTELERLRARLVASEAGGESHAKVAQTAVGEAQALRARLADQDRSHEEALQAMRMTEVGMREDLAHKQEEPFAWRLSRASGMSSVIPSMLPIGPGSVVSGSDDDDGAGSPMRALSANAKTKTDNLVSFLRAEIDEYKAIVNSNAARIADLERENEEAISGAASQATAASRSVSQRTAMLQAAVGEVEGQIEDLKCEHERTMDKLRIERQHELTSVRAHEQHEYKRQVEVLLDEHAEAIRVLEVDANEARDEIMKVATQVAFAMGLEVSTDRLTERIDDLVSDRKLLAQEQHRRAELEQSLAELSRVNDDVARELDEFKAALAEVLLDGSASEATTKQQNKHLPVSQYLSRLQERMVLLREENKRNSRIVQSLEEQLQTNFEEAQAANNRSSKLDDILAAKAKIQLELDTIREENVVLHAKLDDTLGVERSNSGSSVIRKSASVASLPSPPPSIPLPPLPLAPASPIMSNIMGMTIPGSKDATTTVQMHEDQEARITSLEKSLRAEKTLNKLLEDSLAALETNMDTLSRDCAAWSQRSSELETEVKQLRERPLAAVDPANRLSLLAVEEERRKRQAAEAAQARAEERMQALSAKKKKNKASLNCF